MPPDLGFLRRLMTDTFCKEKKEKKKKKIPVGESSGVTMSLDST